MKLILRAIVALGIFAGALNAFAQASDEMVKSGDRSKAANNIYIVEMSDKPVVAYEGGIQGLPATKPRKGQKIDPNSTAVVNYVNYLNDRHGRALSATGGKKIYDYNYTFNGFAAELTPEQAGALKSTPGVLNVSKDELQSVVTSQTPKFLGLTDAGGLWDQLGGFERAGEDIIIGDVDSGIWPEAPSFSDRTGTNGNGTQDGKLSYQQIPGWHGKCTPGEQFTASNCNQKLIGAQRFNAAWGGDAGIKAQRPWEFVSPRDYNAHGTHTASTAGGNHGVNPTGLASVFGPISGMAPRARIAVYKALWSTQDASTASGFNSDLVAAIDAAVADGVDVINYSISGTSTNFVDPVEVAFLNAASAGVFVSAAAGNSGPTASTVNHPSPWLTTVAAGTHNRNGAGSVTVDGTKYDGASFANAITGNLIDAQNAALPVPAGVDAAVWATKVRLCFAAIDNVIGTTPTAVLDPAKIAGKVVLCDRGTNALVNKGLAVQQAGGIGMIITNVSGGATTTLALLHLVPAVHVPFTSANYAALHGAAGAGHAAAIAQATITFDVPAPLTASFSSRGPLQAGGGNLLKPDVIAPGQDILAAVSPVGDAGREFDLFSGTSMATPHIAGLAALLKQLHPDWTPMMIKSALMTTGTDVLDAGSTASKIFSQGAGHVKPNDARDPGLVYNSNINDWFAFLCGATTAVRADTCNALSAAGYSLVPNDLNTPSIAIGNLVGTQTVKRSVTNVGQGTATYAAQTSGVTGIGVSVNPSTLTIPPGQTRSFNVTFTRNSATFNSYAGGQLTWSDGTHNVRVPMVVRPLALSAPPEVSGNGSPINYGVRFGYAGTFSATGRGLVPASTNLGTVVDDPADSFDPKGSGVTRIAGFSIPAGMTFARFSLFNSDVSPASDIDLYVYRVVGSTETLVGSSGGSTSNEEVNLLNPTAGDYVVYVHGFNVSGTANFTLFSWVLGSTNAGNMTVTAPAAATVGGSGTVNLTFSGLTPGTKYLGSVAYSGTSSLPNPTIVRVDP